MAFRRRTKSYPLFSQEFVIHNHADIGFCLVLCVLIGLMFEVTAKTAFLFILPQYNVSMPTADGETVHYRYGPKDLVTVLFYIFIAVILHAVVQEYILDKISKRLHLSKVKHSKFNESGQLVVFHLSSVIWCFYVVVTEGYLTNPRSLWEDYPHVYLPFQVKFFYLCQLAYWLHALPELYFQKVRKEEIPRQLQYICLYLVHIAGAYLLNLSRLGLVLLLLQYSTEFLFHTARLCHFADENNEKLFNAWAAVFGVTRLFILTLAVLAIGFGLARVENQAFDPEKGNFNTLLCRLCVLLLVCAAQAWLMWRFIHSQLRHWREYWSEQSAKRRVPAAPRLAARLIKRESGECGSACGRWAPPAPWTRPAAPPPQRGLFGSCRGLTGMWLGPDGLSGGGGRQVRQGPLWPPRAGRRWGGELWQEACLQAGLGDPIKGGRLPLCPRLPPCSASRPGCLPGCRLCLSLQG
uniref:TLC domain-containing protein n=1 Tax=Capra hircus TaxID=9925 RepID=A0A8C2PAB2_CAPHI